MEEKERYKPIFENCIEDTITQITYCVNERFVICNLLNQQDKRIKELGEENKVGEFWHTAYQGKQLEYDMVYAELRKTLDENQQLKQQLQDLPKKIVGEIINELENSKLKLKIIGIDGYSYTDSFLQTILKKYRGENE